MKFLSTSKHQILDELGKKLNKIIEILNTVYGDSALKKTTSDGRRG